MDGRHFDNLTRSLASSRSRRALLKGLAAGVAAALTAARAEPTSAARAARRAQGAACTRAADCASFRCVDGVCCDASCAGQCESCATGTCLPVEGSPVGGRAACPGSGPCQAACDGQTRTHCAASPGGDVACAEASCADGWQTTYACGGNGSCVPTTTPCAPFGCAADGTTCASGCTGHDQCPGSSHCAGGLCVGDKGLGAACADGAECVHGVCADGVCCAEACGPCQICGADGFCTAAADNSTCSGGLCCEGGCVDTASDVEHCGACHQGCLGDVCQAAICAGGVCTTEALPDGADCADGNRCTTGDACQNGVCVGTPKDCSVADQCIDGFCDPAHGLCRTLPKSNGTPCDDGDACTQTDTCQGGRCVGGDPVVCVAGDECHDVGVCDKVTARCSNPNKADGSSCTGGTVCSQNDTCQGGVCQDGSGQQCATDNPCLISRCNDDGGCNTSAKPAGTPCGGGDACSGPLTCNLFGQCVAADPLRCEDCTVCDPGTGTCQPTNEGGSCTDAPDLCFAELRCRSGVCTGEGPTVCTALDQCHDAGTCDPTTGLCSNPNVEDGTACDDGNRCTTGDRCIAGQCVGDDVDCRQPDDPCEIAVCDAATGNCVNQFACAALDQCHDVGVCDAASGICTTPKLTDGTPCEDGNVCTTNDRCIQGQCEAEPVGCEQPASHCQFALCSPQADGCVIYDHPNGWVRKNCREALCINGEVATEPVEYCHGCGTCDPFSGDCVGWEVGDVCAQTCSSTSRCLGEGFCLSVAEEPCTFGGECSDLVCDPALDHCVETGAKNGQACASACGTCQDGACVTGCPPCTTCEPVGQQCKPCEHCCDGQCGLVACKTVFDERACRRPERICGEVCIHDSHTEFECCPDGRRCYDGETCCPNVPLGTYHCCAAGQHCCPNAQLFGAGNCCATPTCGPQGGCGSIS